MNSKSDNEKLDKLEANPDAEVIAGSNGEFLPGGDADGEEMVDLYEVAGHPEAFRSEAAEAVPDEDDGGMVDLYEIAAGADDVSASEVPAINDIFVFTDDSEDDMQEYIYPDEDLKEYVSHMDSEYGEDDSDEEDEDYSDDEDDEDEDYSDDAEEDEDYSDDEDEEDEDYSDDEDEEDEDYSDDEDEEDEDEDDEDYSDDEDEEDEDYSDEDEEEFDYSQYAGDVTYDYSEDDGDYEQTGEDYFDDTEEDEEFSDDTEDDGDSDEDDGREILQEFALEGAFENTGDGEFSDDNFVVSVFANSSDESETVDLFEVANQADDLPETKEHGALYYWAKRKTAGGWVKFAFKCLGVFILLLLVSVVLYFNGLLDLIDYKAADDFKQYYNLSETDYQEEVDDVYSSPVYYNESTTIEGFNESMIDIPKKDVLNILLIGTDVRGGTYEDRGNTDSMILVSVNTRDKNIKLTSFMRDMYVDIPDRQWARLNAAYAYGGPQLLFDTLKKNFDVDVDLYVRVNFANFRKIINHVGGVNIELSEAEARYMNKNAEKYKTKPVEPGMQRLDGAQALSYARCRKIDSDFNRTKRQRTVIIALIDEIKKCSPGELNTLLNVILPMIQTNMSKMQILGLLADGTRYLNNDVETLNIPIKNSWRTETIRKMSVICPNFELNKTAIVAHIYSTYRLDVEGTKYQSFETPIGSSSGAGDRQTAATTQSARTRNTTKKTKSRTTTSDAPQESTKTENRTSETVQTATQTEKTQPAPTKTDPPEPPKEEPAQNDQTPAD